MTTRTLSRRITGRWRRFTIEHFGCRPWPINTSVPYVSFTFDDFPRSALREGGRILRNHGVRGTYFVSCKLLDSESVSGPIASVSDLEVLLSDGHELGCHTFEHLDGAVATPAEFERSIAANRAALAGHGLQADLEVFAYALNGPAVGIKRVVGRHFAGCRWGGQTFNYGVADLNLLKAYFIDKRSRGDLDDVSQLIRENAKGNGWLIFATHDVANHPSDYGCTPEYFEAIVRLSVASGARVVPMARACRELGALR